MAGGNAAQRGFIALLLRIESHLGKKVSTISLAVRSWVYQGGYLPPHLAVRRKFNRHGAKIVPKRFGNSDCYGEKPRTARTALCFVFLGLMHLLAPFQFIGILCGW